MSRSKKSGKKQSRFLIYSLENAERMLPLLTKIAADFVKNSNATNKALSDLEEDELRVRLADLERARKGYREELRQMGCSTPNVARGIIDVPVWHPHRGEVVIVMVDAHTKSEDDFQARHVDEAWIRGRGFWEL